MAHNHDLRGNANSSGARSHTRTATWEATVNVSQEEKKSNEQIAEDMKEYLKGDAVQLFYVEHSAPRF